MQKRFRRTGLAVIAVLFGSALFSAGASAAINPALTLTQASTQAGAIPTSVGFDLNLNPSSGDSAKAIELVLPPGLLASASIDGGACLTSSAPNANCDIGSGTITSGNTPVPVALYLVKGPSAGDIAGVAVTQQGSTTPIMTADVIARPTSSPYGSGLDLSLANIPASLDVSQANLTVTNMRMPDRCPSTPANVIAFASSQDSSTEVQASAPLQVGGCAALAPSYDPGYAVAAARDASDANVTLTTQVTETADEATSSVVELLVPSNLSANLSAALGDACGSPNATYSNCTPVGTARAVSPLLPAPVPGAVYLTSNSGSFALTIDFPAINLALNGAISLSPASVTFTGVPDVPLTSLVVTLNGGANGLFSTSCNPASTTASAKFTDQNGDKTVTASAPFTVSGCPTPTPPPPPKPAGKPTASRAFLAGLSFGRARLGFGLSAGSHAPAVRSFLVALPRGLRFVKARLRRGVAIRGARIRSIKLSHGRLLVTLASPARTLRVRIANRAIFTSKKLRTAARRHRVKALTVVLTVTNAKGKRTVLRLTFKHPR